MTFSKPIKAVLSLLLLCAGCDHLDREQILGKVIDKTVKRYDGVDTYLISIKRSEGGVLVLQNVDSILELKFNSSDVQAAVQVGKRYQFNVYGWRIPFLSMYQNVLSVQEVK